MRQASRSHPHSSPFSTESILFCGSLPLTGTPHAAWAGDFDVAEDLDQFVEYCMAFYGPGGTYEEFMDHVVTVDLVREATVQLLRMQADDPEAPPP